MLTVSQEKQKDATRNAKWEEYTEVWGGALSSPAGGSRKEWSDEMDAGVASRWQEVDRSQGGVYLIPRVPEGSYPSAGELGDETCLPTGCGWPAEELKQWESCESQRREGRSLTQAMAEGAKTDE